MPANTLQFRATCGLFYWTYILFMSERSQLVRMMRIRVLKVENRLGLFMFVFVVHLLMRCGDIHSNPGPQSHSNKAGMSSVPDAGSSAITLDSLRTMMKNMIDEQAQRILQGTQQQIQAVQTEIAQLNGFVQSLSLDVADVKARTSKLEDMCRKSSGLRDELQSFNTDLETKLNRATDSLEDKLDSLEIYSRRENLIFFGIPESDKENCVAEVIKALCIAVPKKLWSDDDLMRVHRLGKRRSHDNSRHRPILVRFLRWGDRMRVLTEGKKVLRERNIHVAADLTQRQRNIIKSHWSRGFRAYYYGNRLVVEPGQQRQDSRRVKVKTTSTVSSPSPDLPSAQLPSPQLASPQLPSPQLPYPQLPSPQLPSPQLPSPQLLSPQFPSSRSTTPQEGFVEGCDCRSAESSPAGVQRDPTPSPGGRGFGRGIPRESSQQVKTSGSKGRGMRRARRADISQTSSRSTRSQSQKLSSSQRQSTLPNSWHRDPSASPISAGPPDVFNDNDSI